MKMTKTEMLVQSVFRLLRRGARGHIERLLAKAHPSEIAAVVRHLALEDAIAVIRMNRDMEKEAKTFVELEGKFLQRYLDATGEKTHVAEVMQRLPEDEVAALLAELTPGTKEELLSLMKGTKKEEVSEILQYGEDTVGRIMAVNVFCLDQNMTAREAIDKIQQSSGLESLFYVYIVDEGGVLMGVVSMRQLLQVEANRVLKNFMTTEVLRVNVYDSQEKAAHLVAEYNLVSLPVVDDSGKLVGMVTVDDVIDYIRDEADDELLQFTGAEAEAIDDFSFWRAFVTRSVWYALLFVGGIFSSEIILYFFSSFPPEVISLCFAPLALRLGGSVAIQSITFINQGIFDENIERVRAWRALWGQSLTTLLVACLLGGGVFAYGYVRLSQEMALSLGLGLGLILVTLFSICMGLMIPALFHKLRFDSLQASSRFVHFLMDAMNLFVFFQFLRVWRGCLVIGH